MDVVSYEYDLEYGTDVNQSDAISSGQKVVILDDLLATGGTLEASIHLCKQVGAEVVGSAVIVELTSLMVENYVSFKSIITTNDGFQVQLKIAFCDFYHKNIIKLSTL